MQWSQLDTVWDSVTETTHLVTDHVRPQCCLLVSTTTDLHSLQVATAPFCFKGEHTGVTRGGGAGTHVHPAGARDSRPSPHWLLSGT